MQRILVNQFANNENIMSKGWSRGAAWRMLAAGAALLGGVAGWQGPAAAASDPTGNTYAGDYLLMALPPGTFAVINYTGYVHANQFIQNSNNLFGKPPLSQPKDMPSNVGVVTEVPRFAYLTEFLGHPLVLEAAIPFLWVGDKQLGTVPVTVNDGVGDLYLLVDYGLIVDPKNERFVALTNSWIVPTNNYNKFKVLNTSTPNEFTDSVRLAISEGLAKYGAPNFWVDFYANAAFHANGDSPVAVAPGVQFDKLTQTTTYMLEGWLRYQFAPSFFVAAGLEKSWGGNQTASGGVLGSLLGPTSLLEDNYLKGHLEASYPLLPDLHVAADLTHDFQREGGLRENFTAELRVLKLFLPAPPPPVVTAKY